MKQGVVGIFSGEKVLCYCGAIAKDNILTICDMNSGITQIWTPKIYQKYHISDLITAYSNQMEHVLESIIYYGKYLSQYKPISVKREHLAKKQLYVVDYQFQACQYAKVNNAIFVKISHIATEVIIIVINRRTRKIIKRCSLRDNQTRKFITKHTDSAISQLSEVRYTQVDDTPCLMLKYYMVQNYNPIIAYYSLVLGDLIYRAAMDKSKIYEHLTPRLIDGHLYSMTKKGLTVDKIDFSKNRKRLIKTIKLPSSDILLFLFDHVQVHGKHYLVWQPQSAIGWRSLNIDTCAIESMHCDNDVKQKHVDCNMTVVKHDNAMYYCPRLMRFGKMALVRAKFE